MRILVVEDEPDLRKLLSGILQSGGYHVLAAANADEALRLAQNSPVNLVLTDIIMPGINGVELVARLRAAHSSVTVLYMSGYDRDGLTRRVDADAKFIPKPFTPQALLARVAELLGSTSESSAA